MLAAQGLDPLLQSPPLLACRPLPVKGRFGQPQRPAGPVGRALLALHQIPRRPTPGRGAYHFFEFTSSKSEIFKAWSATSLLSRTFSSWTALSFRMSATSIPAYTFFQR